MTQVAERIGENSLGELEVIEFKLVHHDTTGELQSQSFGINVIKVREIIRMPSLTVLPNLPDGVCGIFNLRDQVIPAVDLGYLLFGNESEGDDRKLIVAEFNNMRFGFIVNDVERIHRFPWSMVEAPEAVHEFDPANASIVSIIKTEKNNILMVDVEKIIADINPALAMDKVTGDQQPFGAGLTVVTADDSPTVRAMLKDRLKIAGFDILQYKDGQQAWDALQEMAEKVSNGARLNDIVNLVVTDVEMPQMDGYSLTKSIKAHPILGQLPVIVFSSLVSSDIEHKGKAVGADAQLAKPQISMLLDAVRNLLNK